TQYGNRIDQRNFATYGPNLVVRPLSRELWNTLSDEVARQCEPPVSESIFCDGLVSLVAGDQLKALLELGVACEIELTRLLDDVARIPPDLAAKSEYIERESPWPKFSEKLEVWPEKLGLERSEVFTLPGLPRDWVDTVKDLYKLRNSVAHSGKLISTASSTSVSMYLFAANALFA
ncbi:MAG TPA: hypothetical protein VJ085_04045, partial [Candidatus Acidoferrales bacterium]|nr:hypothetical protein [Candidatus Acidoferrales bacterium]